MFEGLNPLPADPILGLMAKYKNDPNPSKVDLGVGIYRDDQGQTPVLASVRLAESRLLAAQHSKSYVGPTGNEDFNRAMAALLLGDASSALREGRTTLLQTPGGCGALRVAAELIRNARGATTTVWVSDPTWGNHIPLLGNCGLEIKTYPYYCARTNGLDFDAMLATLEAVPAGDVVLLHGCCHNPTGVDLNLHQWQAVAQVAARRGFVPFIDIAYQGLGDGLVEDIAGFRLLAEALPELLFAVSCSKNFGLYRERVGAVGLVATNAAQANAARTHFMSIVRGIYSMPPDHGAAIASEILHCPELTALWHQELGQMRDRINGLRATFAQQMRDALGTDRFDFVTRQKGMFSYLGLRPEEVAVLSDRFGIYMLQTSRVNIAGLNSNSINYVCDSLARVCCVAA